jgi:hypothetical protein
MDIRDVQDNGRRITLLWLVPSLEQQLQTSFNARNSAVVFYIGKIFFVRVKLSEQLIIFFGAMSLTKAEAAKFTCLRQVRQERKDRNILHIQIILGLMNEP